MSEFNKLKFNKKATPVPRMETCEINNAYLKISLSLSDIRIDNNLKQYLKIFPILFYSNTVEISDQEINRVFFGSSTTTPEINPQNPSDSFAPFKYEVLPEIKPDSLVQIQSFLDPLTNQISEKIELNNKLIIENLSLIEDSRFCSLILFTTFDSDAFRRDFNNELIFSTNQLSYSFINLTKNNYPVGQGVYDLRFKAIFPSLNRRQTTGTTDIGVFQGYLSGKQTSEEANNKAFAANISYTTSLNNKKLTSIFAIDKKILCENNSNISLIFSNLTESKKINIVNDWLYLIEIKIKDEKGNLIDSFYHEDQILNNVSNLENLSFYYFNDNKVINKNYYLELLYQDNSHQPFLEMHSQLIDSYQIIENYLNKANYFSLFSVLKSSNVYEINKKNIINNLINYYSFFENNYLDQLKDNFETLLDINIQKNNINTTFNFIKNLLNDFIIDLDNFLYNIGFSKSSLNDKENRSARGSQLRRQGANNSIKASRIRKNINIKLFEVYLNNNKFSLDLLSGVAAPSLTFLERVALRGLQGASLKERFLLENQKYFNINSFEDLEELDSSLGDLYNTSYSCLSPAYIFDNSGDVVLNNTTTGATSTWSPFEHAIKEIIILLDKFNFLTYYQSKKVINFYNSSGAVEQDGYQIGLLKIFIEYFIYMLGVQTLTQDPVDQEINSSLSSFNEESIINLINSRFYLGESENITNEDLLLSRISILPAQDVSWNKNLFNGLITNQHLIHFIHLISEKDDLSYFNKTPSRSLFNDYDFASEDLNFLPNQLKSLSNNSDIKEITTFDWRRRSVRNDILDNPINHSIFKFNFDLLYNIEFLIGFNPNQTLNSQWEKLTRNNLKTYLDSGNIERIICRFIKNNKNTKNYKNLNFNILNQTFFIENPSELL